MSEEPLPTFKLDGETHNFGMRCFCKPRKCPTCGGVQHTKPILRGGKMCYCESCDAVTRENKKATEA